MNFTSCFVATGNIYDLDRLLSHFIVAFTLSARETQAMLLRRGYCDMATSLGLLYHLDLDNVFSYLVDRYLSAWSSEQE